MQYQTSNYFSFTILDWIYFPNNIFFRKVSPILYLLFLQAITGIPKPEALEEFDVGEFAIQFSEKLYEYPYWLQDLSHLPLFFLFTWLAHWFFSEKAKNKKTHVKAIATSVFYAIFNEGIQAFIPHRFPSPGDLFMNLTGVVIAVILYHYLQRKILRSS